MLLLNDKSVTDATSFLNQLSILKHKNKRKIWKRIKPKSFKNETLWKLLSKLSNPQELEMTINNYWKDEWKNTEAERYSQYSAHAYQKLKKILKYHLFEKRDGGIINCIKNEDDSIETNMDKVNALLLKTMKEIQIDKKWEFIEEKEFPKLNRLNQGDMERIIGKFSTGKAIAYDGLSDIIFSNKKDEGMQTRAEITAKKLRNLWRIPFHKYSHTEEIWDTRLIPLNKVFPNAPSRKDLRPIAVQSPLVKLLEGRFLHKLQDYLNRKLDRSQTGFIQKMGIQVNLTRALDRITFRNKQKKFTYGLFIDFSNAYNSIPHKLLFQKLRAKKVLEENEIDFREQLYSRYRLDYELGMRE